MLAWAVLSTPAGAVGSNAVEQRSADSGLASQDPTAGRVELGPAPRIDYRTLLAPRRPAPAAPGLSVDAANRQAVIDFFSTAFTPAFSVAAGWTGSVAGCVAGTTNASFEAATIQVVNYFRAMASLPGNVTFDATLNAKDEKAALMMLTQGALSHAPDPSFRCFSNDGAEAAHNSNLALGSSGPNAIAGYIQDPGANNTELGHRRWILSPPQVVMGTGSTTGGAIFNGSNALWVIGSFGPRPPTPDFVAWPPPGFVPYRVVFARWSFSRQSADFSTATVTMTKDGASIALTVLPIATGFGDNTIGWEPRGVLVGKGMPDATYHASLSGVRVNGKPQSFAYDVTIIDPASSTGTTTTSTGTATTGSATTTSTQTTSTTTTSSTTSTCTKGTKGKREPAAAKKRKC